MAKNSNKANNNKNKKKQALRLLYTLIGVLVLMDVIFFSIYFSSKSSSVSENYNPVINPSNFSTDIDNQYFSLVPKTRYIYEGETEDGMERNEVYVTEDIREVAGVKTRVVWDRVWLNNELIEDTKDWYAQDKEGNVWYFGEDSMEILDGKIVNYDGSWEAGIDGAKPGIIMKANPMVGDKYRQEYYEGKAEDMAEILSLGEKVETPYKTFTNCLKTLDWTPLEKNSEEYKYYCPEVGGVVLEVVLDGDEKVELISFEENTKPTPQQNLEQDLETKITEEEAREIALKEVPGEVTDIAIERKFGKVAYVVEVDPSDGSGETDVIIDVNTGEILGVE